MRLSKNDMDHFTPHMTHSGMTRRSMGLGLGFALAAPISAWAQGFPNRAMRLVVPFPAGGGTDSVARAIAEGLSKELGQVIIVDNKPGAGTVVGNDIVAKSTPDGHTLLLNTSAVAIVPSLYPKLPYSSDTGLAPVMLVGRAPNVAVVRADSPITSAADLLSRARAKPATLAYGSAGNGTSTHLSAELLKVMAKVDITHVPYRGATPMVTDLLGGQIELGFGTLPSVAPFIASGKLRPLAVTGRKRSALLAQVPTFAEAGVMDYEADGWYGLFVSGATPMALRRTLHTALRKTCDTEAFRKRAAHEGLVLSMEDPEEAMKVFRAEEAKWRLVVKQQGLQPD
jgi:tripartite-type tricarboxylate transporter receptor subunit TctC